MFLWPWFGVAFGAYVLGSVPSAYLAGRLARGVDVRALGDRNAGAANVWREVNRPAAVMVALFDIGKGAAAVLLGRALVGGAGGDMVAGIAAVAGHISPVFLGFRGGRGAATALGVLAMMFPQAVFPLVVLALVPWFLTRNLTVCLATVYVPLPLLAWWMGTPPYLIGYIGALLLLVAAAHTLTSSRAERPVRQAHISGHPRV
ncbi:MAG: glycerol-3-phosphate acyltransferase [Chloroflexi bacterium]|nr:glycerol-3-phosphate acyltransferase [Chloroflexota bacterium]